MSPLKAPETSIGTAGYLPLAEALRGSGGADLGRCKAQGLQEAPDVSRSRAEGSRCWDRIRQRTGAGLQGRQVIGVNPQGEGPLFDTLPLQGQQCTNVNRVILGVLQKHLLRGVQQGDEASAEQAVAFDEVDGDTHRRRAGWDWLHSGAATFVC